MREHGGTPIRTKVGHSFIKARMAETGAVFGGEHSAHYYFRDNYRADSGLIAAMMVLERLCAGDEPMSVLRAPYDRYADSGEINTHGRRSGRGDRRRPRPPPPRSHRTPCRTASTG